MKHPPNSWLKLTTHVGDERRRQRASSSSLSCFVCVFKNHSLKQRPWEHFLTLLSDGSFYLFISQTTFITFSFRLQKLHFLLLLSVSRHVSTDAVQCVNRVLKCKCRLTGWESRAVFTCRGRRCPRTGSRSGAVPGAVRSAAPPPSRLPSTTWGARHFCWPAWRARSCETSLSCSETKPGIQREQHDECLRV